MLPPSSAAAAVASATTAALLLLPCALMVQVALATHTNTCLHAAMPAERRRHHPCSAVPQTCASTASPPR